MMTMPTRSEMEEKLSQAFTPEQTTSLVEVLDTIRQAELERAADTRDLKRGLTELTGEVKKLAAAQQRTDERLAQFQERTDERFVELSQAIQTLAETVNTGLTDLRRTVGSLANTFGFNLEEFVAALLPPYLEKHALITELTFQRRYFTLADGRREEVDLVGYGQRAGQPVLVLAECRTTLSGGEMRRIARKLETIEATVTDSVVVKIVVAMNLHPTGEEAAQETAIWAIPYSRINRERG